MPANKIVTVMKKSLLLSAAIFCIVYPSFATIDTIIAADYSFTPSSFTAHTGDTIMWVWSQGVHTTTSKIIPTGAIAWSGNLTPTSTSFMYVPILAGTYSYECIIHSSSDMVGRFTVVNSSLDSDQNPASIITIYPNPVSTSLHIQFNPTQLPSAGLPVSLTLTDINGVMVIRKKFKALKDRDIDLTDIPNNTYYLHAEQGNETYDQQLIVSH